MRVGVLTGGGDCPGLNAVIRSVTKSLINHGQCDVLGIADGFEGLMGAQPRVRPLGWDEVSGILHIGGTILGTSNSANPLRDAQTLAQVGLNIKALALDVVVAIGGDGTMSLAHGLEQVGLQCVGVPKTIDNDIASCERSFGFDTAVATVTESLRRIESTAMSHHRVMIVETMGRHAGWLALEAMCCASACSPTSRARCAPRCWAMCSAVVTPRLLIAYWPRNSATTQRNWCWAASWAIWSRCKTGALAAWRLPMWPTPSAPCPWTARC